MKNSASLLLVTALIPLAAAQQAQAGAFHGVVAQGSLSSTDYQRMGQGKVGTVRIAVPWASVERTLGDRSWGWLDVAVDYAARNRVRVLPFVSGAGPPGTQNPPTDRTSRAAYARFMGALAARYGRGGSFWAGRPYAQPITAFQIRNEQNGPAYWGAKPSPKAYAKVLRAASSAITREDRRAEIVLGGMFGTPRGSGAMESWSYLKALYNVRGVQGSFDTVAIHPYAETLRGVQRQVKKVRSVMRAAGDARAHLRITELGWGSGSTSPFDLGPSGQAAMLKKAFGMFERKSREWRVKGVNWFSWQDNPGGHCSFCPTSGLFTFGRYAKPSWTAFQQVAG